MALQRGVENWTPRTPEPETEEILDTSWDTAPQEIAFISAALEYFGPFGRKRDQLFRLLDCGVNETWFIHENRRYLYLGLFSAAVNINAPNVTVRIGAVIDEAEKFSGETGWAKQEIEKITEKVGLFNLDEFIEKDVPLWWHKLKKPRTLKILGKLSSLLTLMPPTMERLAEIDELASAALGAWRAEPKLKSAEDALHASVRNECLSPIPADHSIPLNLEIFDEALNGGIGGPASPDSGRLIIVCARPGAGKSLVASNIASRIAVRGYKVCFWSFEMGQKELAMRDIAMKDFFYCRENVISDPVVYNQLKRRSYSVDQKERLKSARYDAVDTNMQIQLGNSSMTAANIATQMRTFAQRHPSTRLFIIDPLGLLNISNKNRAVEVGEATRQLKVTARELGIDVLLLCQLNRGVENRDDKRPTLSDLRDSGRIEEDADIVLGLFRPGYYDREDPSIQDDLEVIALKNRQGKSNYVSRCKIALDSCAIYDEGVFSGMEPATGTPDEDGDSL